MFVETECREFNLFFAYKFNSFGVITSVKYKITSYKLYNKYVFTNNK